MGWYVGGPLALKSAMSFSADSPELTTHENAVQGCHDGGINPIDWLDSFQRRSHFFQALEHPLAGATEVEADVPGPAEERTV